MNTPNNWTHDDGMDSANGVSYARRELAREQRMRRHAFERRGARPSSINGMHRRRNKRFVW